MSEDINNYLHGKYEGKNKDRMEMLETLGARINREYSPDYKQTADYPLYDGVKNSFYRIPIEDITDDQWEKLEQMWEEYEIKEVNDRNRSNSLATLIKVAAGTVYIGGFVLGLVLGKDYRGNLSLWSILTYWIVAFVGGTSLLWFAQVLDLLHGVKKYAEMIFTKLTRK